MLENICHIFVWIYVIYVILCTVYLTYLTLYVTLYALCSSQSVSVYLLTLSTHPVIITCRVSHRHSQLLTPVLQVHLAVRTPGARCGQLTCSVFTAGKIQGRLTQPRLTAAKPASSNSSTISSDSSNSTTSPVREQQHQRTSSYMYGCNEQINSNLLSWSGDSQQQNKKDESRQQPKSGTEGKINESNRNKAAAIKQRQQQNAEVKWWHQERKGRAMSRAISRKRKQHLRQQARSSLTSTAYSSCSNNNNNCSSSTSISASINSNSISSISRHNIKTNRDNDNGKNNLLRNTGKASW